MSDEGNSNVWLITGSVPSRFENAYSPFLTGSAGFAQGARQGLGADSSLQL